TNTTPAAARNTAAPRTPGAPHPLPPPPHTRTAAAHAPTLRAPHNKPRQGCWFGLLERPKHKRIVGGGGGGGGEGRKGEREEGVGWEGIDVAGEVGMDN
ncbi:MAG: hypothetical protein GY821_12440, partial [Gammaproteobacteria bacterium]|nr:hypothetical protein [Gammaproteobacteria bacterium]